MDTSRGVATLDPASGPRRALGVLAIAVTLLVGTGAGLAAASAAGSLADGTREGSGGSPAPASGGPLRVLILLSYGSEFAPYGDVAARFRREFARRWPAPVEFHEVALETARFDEAEREAPFVTYIEALFAERKLDLVVDVGGAATRFTNRHRARIFPSIPILHVGTDVRLVAPALLGSLDATAPVANDIPGQVEVILELLPDLENLAIVLGKSPLERYWKGEVARELAPFAGRLNIVWLDDLAFDAMRARVAELPPRSAVLLVLLLVDAAGIPHEFGTSLGRLAAASNAPLFGLFENQLGEGVVGGRLVSSATVVERAVDAASRLMRGEPPAAVRLAALSPDTPIFDRRQLDRWRIPQDRLPPGSEIRFNSPSAWTAYRWPLLGGLGIFALQSALIVGLLLQRRYRRSAEDEVRTLHGRLLTTYEQERRRLARELHDDLTQRLARLAIDAAQVERHAAAVGSDSTLLRMREELVRLSEDVHTLSRRLHPSILDDLGLTDALRSEAERFARAERVEVELRLAETPAELPSETALCLYRVAQEALRNISNHARARRVEVTLSRAKDALELAVRDDGVGFETTPGRRGAGLGHVSLRERLHLVGGRLEITSFPGKGTIVFARVPIAGAAS